MDGCVLVINSQQLLLDSAATINRFVPILTFIICRFIRVSHLGLDQLCVLASVQTVTTAVQDNCYIKYPFVHQIEGCCLRHSLSHKHSCSEKMKLR